MLPKAEADVARKLLEKLEPITQRRLQAELGMPKSSLSRTLGKLEAKGLIRTNEMGNTKLILLEKKK